MSSSESWSRLRSTLVFQPDPIAVRAGLATVILFGPADRVEKKLPCFGTIIMRRLAADDVGGNSFDESRAERRQSGRILAAGQTIALQRANDLRQIDLGLIA